MNCSRAQLPFDARELLKAGFHEVRRVVRDEEQFALDTFKHDEAEALINPASPSANELNSQTQDR